MNLEQAEAKSFHAMTVWVNMAFMTQGRLASALREKQPYESDMDCLTKTVATLVTEMPKWVSDALSQSPSACPFTEREASTIIFSAICVAAAKTVTFPTHMGVDLLDGALKAYAAVLKDESTNKDVIASPYFSVGMDDDKGFYVAIGSRRDGYKEEDED